MTNKNKNCYQNVKILVYNPSLKFKFKDKQMIERIISHMNDHHQAELNGLLQKFGAIQDPKEAKLVGVDTKGLDISCTQGVVRVDFPQEVALEGLKDAIIELCSSVPKTLEYEKIKQEMLEFRDTFSSVVLASIDSNNQAIASYAPLLRYEDRFFIYISEIAEHYASIKANPDSIEVLFLEDESKAKSVILRKRLKYKAKAEFKPKDSTFEQIFDHFEANNPKAGGLKTIRNMGDFHLVELHFQQGRFVKGFGAAYDVDSHNNVTFAAADTGNPHQLPHKQK